MRVWHCKEFGLDNLKLEEVDERKPGPGEALVEMKAQSLNFRDLMVVRGLYNPKQVRPFVPLSDGAGTIVELGEGEHDFRVGDEVVSHFIADWSEGPYKAEYAHSTLGAPGPGVAGERVILPARALVPKPEGWSHAEAATLPIAALTAWSGLVTEGGLEPGGTMLTLGTGGVSIFGVQIAAALGADAIITSSSDDKLARAAKLGARVGVNYRQNEEWERVVLDATDGRGVDVTLETGGAGTLDQSVRATRAGGTIAVIGVLSGASAEISTVNFMMRRQKVQGILVDSRESFLDMIRFLDEKELRPVIDRRFGFEELPAALEHMASGAHFGKLVLER